VAEAAAAATLIVCDVDRGGAFAHLFRHSQLLAAQHRALVRGFVLNNVAATWIYWRRAADAAKPHRSCNVGVLPCGASTASPKKMASSTSALASDGRSSSLPIPTSAISMSLRSGQSCRPVRQLGASGANHRVGGSAHPAGLKNVPVDLAWLRQRGLDAAIAAHVRRTNPRCHLWRPCKCSAAASAIRSESKAKRRV